MVIEREIFCQDIDEKLYVHGRLDMYDYKTRTIIDLKTTSAIKWQYTYGMSLENLQRYEEAIKCYDKAIELDPNYIPGWNNKAVSLDNLQRYEEAIKCYDKAIELDPNYVPGWNGKGASLYNLAKYNEAIQCYDKAIELDPNYVDAWYNRACYRIAHINDIKNGLSDLGKAVEIGKEKYIELANEDKEFESVRNNEEFKKILGIKNTE